MQRPGRLRSVWTALHRRCFRPASVAEPPGSIFEPPSLRFEGGRQEPDAPDQHRVQRAVLLQPHDQPVEPASPPQHPEEQGRGGRGGRLHLRRRRLPGLHALQHGGEVMRFLDLSDILFTPECKFLPGSCRSISNVNNFNGASERKATLFLNPPINEACKISDREQKRTLKSPFLSFMMMMHAAFAYNSDHCPCRRLQDYQFSPLLCAGYVRADSSYQPFTAPTCTLPRTEQV